MNIRKFVVAAGMVVALGVSAFAQTLKIMPLGDSITWGYGGTQSGYRYFLYRDLVADGYGVDYIGNSQSEWASAAALPDHDHCGYSGWCITSKNVTEAGRGGILENIDDWMATLADPDVVLLLLGTNDIASNGDLSDRPEALDQLISKIVANAPKAYVVVASVLKRTDNATWDGYIQNNLNAEIPGIVATHAANGERVRFLDLRSAVDPATGLCTDGLHPNDIGYQQMADAWRAEIEAIFPLSEEYEGYQHNVDFSEWSDYKLVYEFTPSRKTPTYTKDNHLALAEANPAGPTRVAYYLELVKTGETATNYVWVSFDAVTSDLANIGLPSGNYEAQCDLANMNVYCNVDGVATGEAIQTGNIEFWPYTFACGKGRSDLAGSDTTFDINDSINNRNATFGSMQVHNHAAGSEHTVFSYSAWCFSSDMFTGGLGIGSKPQERWDAGNPDPDWTFACNAETDYSYKKMQVFASFAADKSAPAIQSATLSEDATTLTLRFSEKVDPADIEVANFTSDDYTVTSVALGDDGRTATLTGVLNGHPSTVVITVGEIADLVGNTASALTSPAATVIYKGYQANVPESEYGDYTLVYEFTPAVNAPQYDIDNSKTVPSTFNRIAYYLEYMETDSSDLKYAWVSFNAFTDDISKIGIPTSYRYWDKVTAMNVYCNVDGIVTGTNIGTGNIEFWYGNYSGTPSALGLGGSNAFDFDDSWADGGHGCMQIHNYGEKQTILSYSGWGTSGNQGGIGIGNNPAADDDDYTFANNVNSFYYKKMQVLVATAKDVYPPAVASVGYDYDNAKVTVAFSEIINDADAVLDNFEFSEGYIASSISLAADGRSVVISGERVGRPIAIEVTVSGIHDVAGNEMSEPVTQKIVVDYSGYVKNVPENEYRQYSLVYEFTPQESGRPGYVYDASSSFHSTLGRIAYYMEYRRTADSPLEYVWVSFAAPSSDIKALGIPDGTTLWQTVEDMNVYCNVEGVTTGEKITTGSIEFTDWSVNSTRSDVISGGSDDWYDFNDAVNTEGNFGSMQINNYGAEETVFTYSGFMRGDGFGSIGIGNNPNPTNNDSDWTFARNVGSTVYRKIQVFAAVDQSAMTESAETAILDVKTDCGYGVIGVPSAIFTKEGDAELTIGGFVPLADDRIHFADREISVKVNGGSLKIAEAIDTASVDVDTGAYIHLDASKADSLVMEDGYLVEWKDARATSDMKATSVPVYDENDETTLFVSKRLPVVVEKAQNGLSAVDLGGYTYHDASGGTADEISDDSGALVFSGDGEWVRNGFMIVKHNDAKENFLFGDTEFWYFHPGLWGIVSGSSANEAVRAANWHVDGVWVDNMTFALDQNWHLVSFAMYDDRRVQTIGLDRAIRAGGFQVGELILFRDRLTPERRRDIEAALMDKWFAKGYPANTEPLEINNLVFSKDSDQTLVAGRDMNVNSLSSAGRFVKSGAGALSVAKMNGVNNLTVEGGTLQMNSAGSAADVLAKAFAHFDPTVESSLVKNEKGEVVEVHDARGVDTIKNGHGVYLTNNLEGTTPDPVPRIGAKLVENFSNGLPGLDTGDFWLEGTGDLPSDTGGFTMTDSCYPTRAIFMVVEKKGDHDPFFAGATWNYYPLHADSGTLLAGNAQDWAKAMPWYMDGVQVVPTVTPWVADGPHVIGFSYDGDYCEMNMIAAERWCRRGGLILGEILMFNTTLSDDDITAVNDYLLKRWRGASSEIANISIGECASLVCNGNFSIADKGEISVMLPLAADNQAALRIAGTFGIGENVSVIFDSKGRFGVGNYPLVSADQIENAENISTWTLETTSGKSGRLQVVGDTVYAVISGGLAIFVK